MAQAAHAAAAQQGFFRPGVRSIAAAAPARLVQAGGIDASRAVLWRPGGSSRGSPSLYWAPQSRCPTGEGIVAYSTEDKAEFFYEAFNEGRDFGPLDIARTVMYCHWVDALCKAHGDCAALVHLSSDASAEERANSVLLCCAYLMLAEGLTAETAWRPFASERMTPFLDCRGDHSAGSAICDEADVEFELSALDVLGGLEKALNLGWLDYRTFGVEEHAQMLRPENGDMSWLIPGKALALASPWAEPHDGDGLPVCTPQALSTYFRQHGIVAVVQCNDPLREEEGDRRRLLNYWGQSFEECGVNHVPMPFEDGGCPSVDILLRFLDLAQSRGRGGVAVHCRSGLGRTATLIGAYAMHCLGFTARSFIGWARLMRPGSVHGSQQQYLCNLEKHLGPGAATPLASLDERERLRLLPRRELRFWALDSGIPANATRFRTDEEIVEMILQAHGLHVPLAAPVTRGYDGPVLHARAKPQEDLGLAAGNPAVAGYASSSPSAVAQDVAPAARPVPSSLNGLSSALANLRRGLPNGALEQASKQLGPGAQNWLMPSLQHSPSNASKLDEWDEVLRYVHLLISVHDGQGDAAAWEDIRQLIEQLRHRCCKPKAEGLKQVTPSVSEAQAQALQKVREARAAAAEEAQKKEAELEQALQEAREHERLCEQLRSQIALERQERSSEQRRLAQQREVVATQLARDEAKLELAVREVEELRGHVLKQGGLAPWQVEKVEQLRRDITKAKAEAASAKPPSPPRQPLEAPSLGGHFAAAAAALPSAGSRLDAEGLHSEPPWDNARRSIEQLRDRFQMAVQQARQTIAAS
eukprot:TRINITY_DN29890_c0_g1_i1.p1 TRINITY_DN29890_c0_g1~~TRINITY_DN29890_c0_g1_i1.p1  ORF type:complete len:814 (-),score=193.26 TRINITY_DN29890_c0_g1_i1:131-2572(-)